MEDNNINQVWVKEVKKIHTTTSICTTSHNIKIYSQDDPNLLMYETTQ